MIYFLSKELFNLTEHAEVIIQLLEMLLCPNRFTTGYISAGD